MRLVPATIYQSIIGAKPGRRRPTNAVHGAALLEVVVSLGLLVFGMAMVGMQINSAIEAAYKSDTATRASMLLDTKLAEFNAGVLETEITTDAVSSVGDVIKGDFGIYYPGFSWRIEIEKTEDIEGFFMVTAEIGYNRALIPFQISNPDYEIDIEDEGPGGEQTQIVQTAYLLWAIPAKINLERDYGITQEDLEKFLEVANEAAEKAANEALEGTDVEGQDVGSLMGNYDNYLDLLTELLTDPDGFDPRMLVEYTGDDFAELVSLVEDLLKGGGDAQALNKLLRNESRPEKVGER